MVRKIFESLKFDFICVLGNVDYVLHKDVSAFEVGVYMYAM